MSRAYLCVSIDTECDRTQTEKSRPPPSFAGVKVGILERLQPLFASFGAKPTYLVSPEVIRDTQSAEGLRKISGSCELGGRLDGQAAELEAWGRDDTAESRGEAEKERLRSLTDALIQLSEYQPLSFRAGLASRWTIGLLEELGYVVESSVTPYVDPAGSPKGTFDATPTQPYRPDREDPKRPGDSAILEIPITIRRRFWSALPGIGRRAEPRWLRPSWTRSDALVRLAEDEISEARRVSPGRPVVLNAVVHVTDVVPVATPYAHLEARVVLDRLRDLLAFARRESIAVIGLGDVPEVLGA